MLKVLPFPIGTSSNWAGTPPTGKSLIYDWKTGGGGAKLAGLAFGLALATTGFLGCFGY